MAGAAGPAGAQAEEAQEQGEAEPERGEAEPGQGAAEREQEAAAEAAFTSPILRPIAPRRRTTSRHAPRAKSGTASIIDAFGAAAESFRIRSSPNTPTRWRKPTASRRRSTSSTCSHNPDTPRALNYRGYATRKLGRTDEGIGYYLKSVALDPVYPQVREYLGEAYVIEGKFDLAKDQLATIGKICGTQCEYYGELAKALADVHAL